MRVCGDSFVPSDDLFLTIFSPSRSEFTVYQYAQGAPRQFWCIVVTRDDTKYRIVFICDNWQSCRAILRGSRVPAIQRVTECIFFWCLNNNRIYCPIWVPRTHHLIQEADRRSRLHIHHDDRPFAAVGCVGGQRISPPPLIDLYFVRPGSFPQIINKHKW